MTMANSPKIEEIRHRVRISYHELHQFLDGPAAHIDPARVYQAPGAEEWTLMENLAHIAEFLPYWGDQIASLAAHPGQKFGRDQKHEGRLRAIAEHASDSMAQAKAALSEGYQHLDTVLGQLQDSDLEVTGQHSKLGEHDVAWFIDEFIVRHLANHVLQMKNCL